MIAPDDPRHGTHAGHVAGCRNQCCRDGAARYERGRQWDIIQGRSRTVPAIGARRRINALQAIGWSAEYLSKRLGHSRAWLNMTLNHNGSGLIYRRNFDKIDALYRELHMTLGPSDITRQRAANKGWAPPLAWDDRDLDDPNAVPHGATKATDDDIDHVVVQRLLDGKRIDSTPAEKAEAIRRWMANGGSRRAICQTHGWHESRYKQEAS